MIKWFHSEGETEVPAARTLRTAHQAGTIDAHILDLAVYEIGNVLLRALNWSAGDASDQLADVLTIFGTPVRMQPEWLDDAASLASQHRLSFYDACWAAAARGLNIALISADKQLLRAGLAESATAAVSRLRL